MLWSDEFGNFVHGANFLRHGAGRSLLRAHGQGESAMEDPGIQPGSARCVGCGAGANRTLRSVTHVCDLHDDRELRGDGGRAVRVATEVAGASAAVSLHGISDRASAV